MLIDADYRIQRLLQSLRHSFPGIALLRNIPHKGGVMDVPVKHDFRQRQLYPELSAILALQLHVPGTADNLILTGLAMMVNVIIMICPQFVR